MIQRVLVKSNLKGRARLEVPSLYRSEYLTDWLERGLSSHIGIRSVRGNYRSATLLIYFNSEETKLNKIIRAIKDLLQENPKLIRNQYYRRKTQVPSKKKQLTPIWPWHCLNTTKVLKICSTLIPHGLSTQEAQRRIKLYGPNQLPIPPHRTEFEIFQDQFKNLPMFLLIGSAGLSAATGGLVDAVVILSVVIINAYLGYAMESSAEKTIHTLTQTQHTHCKVIRNGKIQSIRLQELVIGDLVILFPGAHLFADIRICQSNQIKIDESILTGESLPIAKINLELNKKNLPLSGRINMGFRGTTVTSGSGLGVVVATGEFTELGKIQSLMGATVQPETPLQRYLNYLGNRMVFISSAISITTLILGLLRGTKLLDSIKTAISLAVAAIPEGLPTVATMTLARGVKNLEKHRILIRQLEAVEAFGNLDVICLDKTGTLTCNKMTVASAHTFNRHFEMKDRSIFFNQKRTKAFRYPELLRLIQVSALCNEAQLASDNPKKLESGSSTELALLRFAKQSGIDIDALNKVFPLTSVRHRSEQRNSMTTFHKVGQDGYLLATKGSPNEVLNQCSFYMENGIVYELDKSTREQISRENIQLAEQSLRVLGIAYREVKNSDALEETHMVWLGLVGMTDPIRPGIQKLIHQFHSAGIRTVMITGDQYATASAVGKALNISGEENSTIIDSTQLDHLKQSELSRLVANAHIFARVSPSHKLKIVQALQNSGRIVAMTGDGINDGPALKIADIGIAMGANGSDTARRVADVVLTQDNLHSLILAVQEGRNVHENIRKAVGYIISQNLSELIFNFVAILLGLGEPLTPLQLLWVNLITDLFPELALSQDPPESNLLRHSPFNPNIPIVTSTSFRNLVGQASILSGGALWSYYSGIKRYGFGPKAKTMGFMTLNTASLFHVLSSRSELLSIFDRKRLQNNPYVPLSVGIGFLAESAAVYMSFLRPFLETEPLSITDLFTIGTSSMIPFILIEGSKFMHHKIFKILDQTITSRRKKYGTDS